MLILSRKTGERIRIGASVVVTRADAGDGRVRLAYDASADMSIDRIEVRRENPLPRQRSSFGPRTDAFLDR